MAAAQKFLFDRSFDAADRPTVRGPVAPAEPTYGRAELVAAEAKARAEGHAEGFAAAVSAHEARLAGALDAIAKRLAGMIADQDAMRREGERQILELTRLLIAKLFPALARREGLGEIEALVDLCLRECFEEPRVVLRVPEALFAQVQERIEPLAVARGFQGKLIVLAEETLGLSDCRVEWADGGAERDTARSLREIEAALGRAMRALTPDDDTSQRAADGVNQESIDG